MLPVVDRLEIDYDQEIIFQKIDVGSPDGEELFRFYKLLGHPSYILLSSENQILWRGQGELPYSTLKNHIETALRP